MSAIDRSCRAISTTLADVFYGPASERAKPAAAMSESPERDGEEVQWRTSTWWDAIMDYDRDFAPYLEGRLGWLLRLSIYGYIWY